MSVGHSVAKAAVAAAAAAVLLAMTRMLMLLPVLLTRLAEQSLPDRAAETIAACWQAASERPRSSLQPKPHLREELLRVRSSKQSVPFQLYRRCI